MRKKVVEAGDKNRRCKGGRGPGNRGNERSKLCYPKKRMFKRRMSQKTDVQKADVQKDELPFAAEDSPKVAADDPALQAFLKGLM